MEVQTSEYPVSNLRREIVSKYHGRLHDILICFFSSRRFRIRVWFLYEKNKMFVFRILETPTDVSNR